MDDNICGNCGWDGIKPLDSGIPKEVGDWSNFKPLDAISKDAIYSKVGDWSVFKQSLPECEPNDTRLKGCLIFYIDIGALPPFKAEAFVERVKERICSERLKKNYELIFVPVRPNSETRVEFIPLSY